MDSDMDRWIVPGGGGRLKSAGSLSYRSVEGNPRGRAQELLDQGAVQGKLVLTFGIALGCLHVGPMYRILMIMNETPTSEPEDLAKRGEEVYERDILPRLGPDDQGKAVAIEVETGDYEIDKNEVVAAHRLRERHPAAAFWFRRVGSRYFYRFGHHRSSAA